MDPRPRARGSTGCTRSCLSSPISTGTSPAVAEAMHDVLRFWLDRGVDGFRMDVVHKIGKDPELARQRAGPPPRRGLAERARATPRHSSRARRLRPRPDGRWGGVRARPACTRAVRLRRGRAAPGPQLRLPQPAVVGLGVPRNRERVRGARRPEGMAGLVPWQPRPLADRHPLRPRARPSGGDAVADPPRHAIPVPGRRAGTAGRRGPARPRSRRRRARPRALADPLGAALGGRPRCRIHNRRGVAAHHRRRRAAGGIGAVQ